MAQVAAGTAGTSGLGLGLGALGGWWPGLAAAAASPGTHRLAAGWRRLEDKALPRGAAAEPDPQPGRAANPGLASAPTLGAAHAGQPSADRVGVLQIDWARGQIEIAADLPAPGRVHGLVALPDGGFVAVANRPGRWLMRCDAQGQLQQWLKLDPAISPRSLNGHALLAPDSRELWTTETDPCDGQGWVTRRRLDDLQPLAEHRSAGVDPHHLLWADETSLLVANGGIPRDAQGQKLALDRMAPSLVRLRAADGELLGRWQLSDARLSLRHLAWTGPATRPLLGVALQAEHDDIVQRREAPTLALWDGRQLTLASFDMQATGYAGDIAAAGDGWVLSGQRAGLGLRWQPGGDGRLSRVAELREICALATTPDQAVLMAAARGAARWHPDQPARLLRWPQAMAPDNHWVLLR